MRVYTHIRTHTDSVRESVLVPRGAPPTGTVLGVKSLLSYPASIPLCPFGSLGGSVCPRGADPVSRTGTGPSRRSHRWTSLDGGTGVSQKWFVHSTTPWSRYRHLCGSRREDREEMTGHREESREATEGGIPSRAEVSVARETKGHFRSQDRTEPTTVVVEFTLGGTWREVLILTEAPGWSGGTDKCRDPHTERHRHFNSQSTTRTPGSGPGQYPGPEGGCGVRVCPD